MCASHCALCMRGRVAASTGGPKNAVQRTECRVRAIGQHLFLGTLSSAKLISFVIIGKSSPLPLLIGCFRLAPARRSPRAVALVPPEINWPPRSLGASRAPPPIRRPREALVAAYYSDTLRRGGGYSSPRTWRAAGDEGRRCEDTIAPAAADTAGACNGRASGPAQTKPPLWAR